METFDEFEARLLKKLEAFKAQQKADVQRLEAQLAEMQQLVDEHNRKRRVARAAQLQRQVLKAQKKATRLR